MNIQLCVTPIQLQSNPHRMKSEVDKRLETEWLEMAAENIRKALVKLEDAGHDVPTGFVPVDGQFTVFVVSRKP